MQRERLFTAWTGLFDDVRGPGGAAVAALLCLLVLTASVILLEHPKPAVWDQARLLEARFEAPFHPSPPYGFTAQLCVIALKALLPADAPLHDALRIFAMAFWAASACWLALAVLERRLWVAVLLLALFTSQLPFLWLSTELIVGGFLCLALGAWVRGWHPVGVGVLLTLVGLSKPELALVAVVLAVCFAVERPTTRRPLAWAMLASAALLLAPGLMLFGPDYLVAYSGHGTGRAFAAFGQHFAALIAPLQLAPTPEPWAQPGPYVERVFPGAHSMFDVVTAPHLLYLDHVALACVRGIAKVGWLFQWAWPAVPVLWLARRRAGLGASSVERVLLWTFVGCVPFVLFAYPHIRYFARYYPLFWLLLLLSVERLERAEEFAWRRPALALAGAFLLAALAVNAERSAVGLAAAPYLPQYWFSD